MTVVRRPALSSAAAAAALLCGVVVLVDTVFYAVLSPLLAGYADALSLDRTAVGLLVAAYPLGMAVGSLPAGSLASRVGPRRVLVAGVLSTAVTCVLFATATTGPELVVYRFLQGAGGALSWTAALVWVSSIATPDRRGAMIGRLFGLAVVGGILGPVLGAVASVVGTAPVFLGVAVVCLMVAVTALRQPSPQLAETQGWRGAARLVRVPRVRLGLWLTALGGVGFGVVNSSAPLALEHLGADALAVSGVFLAMAACGAVVSPWIGRRSDVVGRAPVATGLLVAATVSLVAIGFADRLAVLVLLLVVAATSLEALYVPGGALVVDGTAAAGVAGGEILALANLLWAAGMAVASVVAGVTASTWGDATPYLLVSAMTLTTVVWAVVDGRRGPHAS